jgi:hypothetical protein
MSDDDGGSPLPAADADAADADDDDTSTNNDTANPRVHQQTVLEEADDNTLRVMLSTDNHLGYAERDPVRGMYGYCYCYAA